MCPRPPKTSCAHMPKFHDPSTRNRIVKRFKLKPVVAFGKSTKWPFFSQKSTFLDFLTTKCAPDLPKCLVFQNPSSLARARKIGLSKGSNWSQWWPFENWQNCHFFNNFCSLVCKWSEIVLATPERSFLLVHPLLSL